MATICWQVLCWHLLLVLVSSQSTMGLLLGHLLLIANIASAHFALLIQIGKCLSRICSRLIGVCAHGWLAHTLGLANHICIHHLFFFPWGHLVTSLLLLYQLLMLLHLAILLVLYLVGVQHVGLLLLDGVLHRLQIRWITALANLHLLVMHQVLGWLVWGLLSYEVTILLRWVWRCLIHLVEIRLAFGSWVVDVDWSHLLLLVLVIYEWHKI